MNRYMSAQITSPKRTISSVIFPFSISHNATSKINILPHLSFIKILLLCTVKVNKTSVKTAEFKRISRPKTVKIGLKKTFAALFVYEELLYLFVIGLANKLVLNV